MTKSNETASASPKTPTELTYAEWAEYGVRQGWVGPPVCYTHDGLPLTEDEEEEFEQGDPCVHILRLYPDDYSRANIEMNHAPSNWRKSYPALL